MVAFRNTIILIEAKVDQSWSNEQFKNKVKRIVSLKQDLVFERPNGENGWKHSTKIYFLLMSLREPKKLCEDSSKSIAEFNGWTGEPKKNWFRMTDTEIVVAVKSLTPAV